MKKYLLVMSIFTLFLLGGTPKNIDNSYIVMDKATLCVLEAKQENRQMLIASTTKILTAITVIENYDLNEEIIISNKDVKVVGSKAYFRVNEVIKRIDLLFALMLRSANDAASALSDNDGKEFIDLMNVTAKKIGMKNSVFTNASGLDEDKYNLSTAYDMAKLSAYADDNEIFVSIASTHFYKCKTNFNDYAWANKHKLVQNDECFQWGKTGYTKKAGRILVSNYCKKNLDLIIVTINDSDDWNTHKMFSNSVKKYSYIKFISKGVYDLGYDFSYYLVINEDVVLPIIDKNKRYSVLIKALDNSCVLFLYCNDDIIFQKEMEIIRKDNYCGSVYFF